MRLEDCNPFLRVAEIQPAVLEGEKKRRAYDCRLFLTLEGTGKAYIGEQVFDMQKSCCMYIPVGVPYTFVGKLKVVVFNFDFTRNFSERKTPVCPAPENHYDNEKIFDTALADGFTLPFVFFSDAFTEENFLEIVKVFNAKGEYADALCSSLLKGLLVDVTLKSIKKPTPDTMLAEKVLCYIKLHAAEITDNLNIAEELGYHPVYIESVFKKKTGKTIHETIVQERLKLACKYLSRTDKKIEEIALSTGFASRSHFCTVFKKNMAMTPNAYRKNYQN